MQETTVVEQGPANWGNPQFHIGPGSDYDGMLIRLELTREELSRVATPAATSTHKLYPHISVVEKLIEALSFRQVGVVREKYTVSSDGVKMFAVMVRLRGMQVACRLPIMPISYSHTALGGSSSRSL